MPTRQIASTTIANHTIEIWERYNDIEPNGFAYFILSGDPILRTESGYHEKFNPAVLLTQAVAQVRMFYPGAEAGKTQGNTQLIVETSTDAIAVLNLKASKRFDPKRHDYALRFGAHIWYVSEKNYNEHFAPLGFCGYMPSIGETE